MSQIEIIPSVLARTWPTFRTRLTLAERLASRIHVDVMDGKFVPTRSIPLARLRDVHWHRRVGLHLMVESPELWIEAALSKKVEEIIIHVELGAHVRTCLALFRSNRKRVALAINPTTPLSKLWKWLPLMRDVHVMTVHPGRNHAPFQPKMIERVAEIRRRAPRVRITCDGGITPRTIDNLARAGANRCIEGSYLQFAAHPRAALQRLQRAAQQ